MTSPVRIIVGTHQSTNQRAEMGEGQICLFLEELRQLLTQNELQIRAIQTLWEQHLQEALKDWEQQYASITQVHTHRYFFCCIQENFKQMHVEHVNGINMVKDMGSTFVFD